MKKNLDNIRGSLIGGAAGDALGYAVEFLSEEAIFKRYGEPGITEYHLQDGLGRISDDTQMTLFTANGLLIGTTRGCMRGIQGPYPSYISKAYQEWYMTQLQDFSHTNRENCYCWLMNIPKLYSRRAPGNTCINAIGSGGRGSVSNHINDSKGCGGVMRVAPIGLYFDEKCDDLKIDRIGAEAAALTHGHEMGYIPAALLVHIVRYASQADNMTLKEIVQDGLGAIEALFWEADEIESFLELIQKAITLAESNIKDLDAIHALGQGWVGDEALAIAIYCALKYEHDFDKALIASVNHNGDSDSTGAIAGNILGAYLGLSQIPEKYTKNLELRDVILEIADDLYYDCQIDEYSNSTDPRDVAWEKKYITITYGKEH